MEDKLLVSYSLKSSKTFLIKYFLIIELRKIFFKMYILIIIHIYNSYDLIFSRNLIFAPFKVSYSKENLEIPYEIYRPT